jgi:hypothetical protein
LSCGANNISSLPPLPEDLLDLGINATLISSLPNMPSSLTLFDCRATPFVSLPNLPNTLRDLYCGSNQLTYLPALPNSLKKLDCYQNTSLTCLPTLPINLEELVTYQTAITCLPNKPLGIATHALPVCNATNNPNQCATVSSTADVLKTEVKLFPNPLTTETLNILGANGASVKLFTTMGKEAQHWDNIDEQILLDKIASGIYFLEITHRGGRKSVQKLVVE